MIVPAMPPASAPMTNDHITLCCDIDADKRCGVAIGGHRAQRFAEDRPLEEHVRGER